jgi:hypothetical protein
MKELKLNYTDKVVIVDDEDYERLSLFKWQLSGRNDSVVSRCFVKSYKTYHASIAAEIMRQPKQMFDHIDRNPLNNSKSNLRPCTRSQNNTNRTKKLGTSSKYIGVTKLKSGNKWQATVVISGRKIYLGRFSVEEDAARAYDTKALELFREFANLNFK